MTLTCNGTLHCICTGTSHSMGVSAWLKLNTTFIDKWLGTVGPSSIESHGRMTWKTCVGYSKKGWTLPRVRNSVTGSYTPTVKVQKV